MPEPLTIPADLGAWPPQEVQRWADDVHEDPTVTELDWRRATAAVNWAILGPDMWETP